jgi:hypothetical protein
LITTVISISLNKREGKKRERGKRKEGRKEGRKKEGGREGEREGGRGEGRKGGKERQESCQILLRTRICSHTSPKPTFGIPRLCGRRPFFFFTAKGLVIRTAIRILPFTESITVTQCICLIELSDTAIISVFTTTKTSTVLPLENGSFESSTFQNGVIPSEISS